MAISAFFSFTLQADPSPSVQINVWSGGHIPTLKSVLPPNYVVLDRKVEQSNSHDAGYLEPSRRDALFRKTGIERRLKMFDDLDKDLLVVAIPHYSVSELKAQYPMLEENEIRALKRELGSSP